MTTPILRIALAAALACSLAACKKEEDRKTEPAVTTPTPTPEPTPPEPAAPAGKSAQASLESRSGSTVTGTVTLTEKDGKVEVVAKVEGLTPGDHGFHIHEKGDCSAPDAKSAGDHFNPDQAEHGAPEAAAHHAGDFGNLTAGDDGKADKTWTVDFITLDDGPRSAVGKAFVVHEKPDDLKSQPSGNAGARIACGVIAAK
jgi:superoxide dismutase, Cu-Zn family